MTQSHGLWESIAPKNKLMVTHGSGALWRAGWGQVLQTAGCMMDSRMYVQHREYSQDFVITVNGK